MNLVNIFEKKRTVISFVTLYNFHNVQPYSLANLNLGAAIYHSHLYSCTDIKMPSFNDSNSDAQHCADNILKDNPDIVFFSCYIWNEKLISDISEYIAKQAPDVVIVVGGLSVLYGGDEFYKGQKHVDLFVRGEGEDIVVRLVSEYIRTSSKPLFIHNSSQMFGVSSQDNFVEKAIDRITVNVEDLKSPYLTYSKELSFFDYINGDYKYIFMELARGCVYTCAFCSFDSQELGFRKASLDRIKKELIVFSNHNVGQIFFVDAIWGGRKNDAKRILDFISNNNLHFESDEGIVNNTFLYGYFRPELIDEEFAEGLSKANFSMVQLGIQTINPNVDKIMRRNNVKQIIKNVPLLRKYEVPFQVDLIVGFPGDDFFGLVDSICFVMERCRPTNFRCYTLAVNPGTPLAKLADERGTAWVDYDQSSMKVTSSYSFTSSEMKKMEEFSNLAVALYDTYITNKTLEHYINRNFLLEFYDYCKTINNDQSKIVLNNHQFNEKSKEIGYLIKEYTSIRLEKVEERRDIYGRLYTR